MVHLIYLVSLSLLKELQQLDLTILTAIYEFRRPVFDITFVVLTNSAAAFAFGIPGVLLIYSLFTKNHELHRKAFIILISVVISAIFANVLKYIVDLPRPYELYPYIKKLSVGGSPSFPSGHTADAFAFAFAAILVYRKWFILIPCLVWAAMVGYSRMYLGVHFPSDVLGGAIIGIGGAFASRYLIKRYIFKMQ